MERELIINKQNNTMPGSERVYVKKYYKVRSQRVTGKGTIFNKMLKEEVSGNGTFDQDPEMPTVINSHRYLKRESSRQKHRQAQKFWGKSILPKALGTAGKLD